MGQIFWQPEGEVGQRQKIKGGPWELKGEILGGKPRTIFLRGIGFTWGIWFKGKGGKTFKFFGGFDLLGFNLFF